MGVIRRQHRQDEKKILDRKKGFGEEWKKKDFELRRRCKTPQTENNKVYRENIRL